MILNNLTSALLLIVAIFLMGSITILARNLTRLRSILRHISVMLQKNKERTSKQISLSEKQKLAEEVIEKGSAIVETVHKTISEIPFGILESTPATGPPTRIVRKIHDRTAAGVYDSIRFINKGIGKIADGLLGSDKDSNSGDEDKNKPGRK